VVRSMVWSGGVELIVDSEVTFGTISSIPNKEKKLNSISRDICQIMYAV
jgi:hypothetical protein